MSTFSGDGLKTTSKASVFWADEPHVTLFHRNSGPNSVVILFLRLIERYNALHKGVHTQ